MTNDTSNIIVPGDVLGDETNTSGYGTCSKENEIRSIRIGLSSVRGNTISVIPYATTKSYKEIAEISGYNNAFRAVGSVNRKNRLARHL